MSTAVATAKVDFKSIDQKTMKVFGSISIGAGDYALAGLALSLAGQVQLDYSAPLEFAVFDSNAGANGVSYVYQYTPGTTFANGKLVILGTNAASTGGSVAYALQELAAAVLPTNITSEAKLRFVATFAR